MEETIKPIFSYIIGTLVIVIVVGIAYMLYKYRQDKAKVASSNEAIIEYIDSLTIEAIWAVGFVIEMVSDILSWINGKLEGLLNRGANEVDVVRGDALADFIKQNQATGKYKEVSLENLNVLNNSVINVAMNSNVVVDNQMIRSNGGLSSAAESQFKGQPTLKIKIAA